MKSAASSPIGVPGWVGSSTATAADARATPRAGGTDWQALRIPPARRANATGIMERKRLGRGGSLLLNILAGASLSSRWRGDLPGNRGIPFKKSN